MVSKSHWPFETVLAEEAEAELSHSFTVAASKAKKYMNTNIR